MDIGRKIYYDKLTGNILQDTGERSGDVVETTIIEDANTLTQLQGQEVGVIQLQYGERYSEFLNMGSMSVNPSTKEFTIYPRLIIQSDKLQIQSDGVDTATITSDYATTFCVDGGEDYAVNPFLFSSNVAGTYTITAKSTLHGQNSLTIEVI